jgi:hypothetical protein
MQGKNAILEGGQELSEILNKDFSSGTLFQRLIDSINSLSLNVGLAPIGKLPPPVPVNNINVKGALSASTNTIVAPSEILHWTIQHNGSISKHTQYFTEIDTSPNFPNPHVYSHGASRTGFLHLPTLQDDGVTPNTYYMRSYPQLNGSDAQKPTVLGGLAGPTKIQMTPPNVTVGGVPLPAPSIGSLLTSTGSGTAAANGSQGGQGLGTSLVRPAPSPKRNVS